MSEPFQPDRTYDQVYLLFVDTAGYSTIVRSNPRDRAAHAFDLLRERMRARIGQLAARHRCARSEVWSWRGDGGFFAVHDESESVARDVVLEAARAFLTLDLRHLRDEFAQAGVAGELHVRMAVHKGAIRHTGEGRTGTIHSPDINLAAHLEKATPADCLAVSEDVYRTAGPYAELFAHVGSHEGKDIYLMAGDGGPDGAAKAWLAGRGLADGAPVHAYPERPSPQEKARLLDAAAEEVLDMGTALRTSSSRLVTTERPARYRDAVLGLLRRGGTYRCYVLDPSSDAAATLSRQYQEDMARKIKDSLERFGRFKERYGADAEGLRVYQTDEFPGFSALGVDVRRPGGLILYCSYLTGTGRYGVIERGDMPHYLIGPAAGRVFVRIRELAEARASAGRVQRVL
ncbi:aromatic ring-opening dioxygenase LigA [Streptomyces hygroscopicus]|uniref:aromatic ring-opening dioxygenase LigA n=1 Tax=Streptomyces hygroscopicus TaxID=1912 RepID=UPI0004C784CE|nr:aromatic ring-opening dioxygenase LigA [Streptomyces hygroscopicus]